MKLQNFNKKWILTIVGLLFILIIVKIILLWIAKPKVAIDYVAQYNQMTCPPNYEPNKNAADDYQKAFDSFIEIPQQLDAAIHKPSLEFTRNFFKDMNKLDPNTWKKESEISYKSQSLKIDWPGDFNDDARKCLKEWLASNKQAFGFFRTASRKPYYWIERGVKKDIGMQGMIISELSDFSFLIEAKLWDARDKAVDGKFQLAFEDIVDCYHAGNQRCEIPSLSFEQIQGRTIKERTINTCLCILNRVQFTPQNLTKYQNLMKSQFDENSKYPDFEAERLLAYDTMQRIFVYDKKGNGRISCKFVKLEQSYCDGSYQYKQFYKLLKACLFGPTFNEMSKRIEEKFAAYQSAITETPWQLHLKNPAYLEKLNVAQCNGCKDDFILDEALFPNFYSPFNHYYRLKAKERALITILAIQRYKSEKGTLPLKLDELVSNGYLKDLPLDPYSDGPLVYCVNNNDFTLYSIGQNFKDDDGKGPDGSRESKTDDIVFWPPVTKIVKM